jgi:hypothetical protein
MGHPAKMKAITAGKNKSDQIDARSVTARLDQARCGKAWTGHSSKKMLVAYRAAIA